MAQKDSPTEEATSSLGQDNKLLKFTSLRYIELSISLADDSDNEEAIYFHNGRKASSVTLTGRT